MKKLVMLTLIGTMLLAFLGTVAYAEGYNKASGPAAVKTTKNKINGKKKSGRDHKKATNPDRDNYYGGIERNLL